MLRLTSLVAALAAAAFAQGAMAQASAPASRGQVKAEAQSAEKAKQTPAGEGSMPDAAPQVGKSGSMADRKAGKQATAERKAETRKAMKDHKTTPAGEGPSAAPK